MTAYRFADLMRDKVLRVSDGYRAKNSELGGDGPIFLRGAYLQDQGFVLNDPDRFIGSDLSRFGDKIALLGDTIITTKGNSTGRVGFVDERVAGSVYSPHLSYWRSLDRKRLNPRFLHYWSRGAEFSAQLHGLAFATDMAPYLSLRDQMFISITLPEIMIQEAIGSILGGLDDKIELNRRMSATLEEMARALFRSWFVDFDAVHAKVRGEAPAHMDAATAALFPDRFGEDGLPEGWKEGTLSDVAVLNPEKWGTRNAPAMVEYVDLSNTKWGVIEATAIFEWSEAPSRARMILREGDTVVGTVRPGNGSYAYIGTNGLTGSTGFAVLRAREFSDGVLVYLAATDPENIDALAHRADGAAYPAVRPDVVAASPLVTGSTAVRAAFSAMARPLLDRSEAAKQEARLLAALRDSLLPKLMSGELRVRDAEQRIVEAV